MFNPGVTLNTDAPETLRRIMAECFRREITLSKFRGMWAFITRRLAKLLNLQTVVAGQTITNRHYIGLQSVAISQITGSENHTPAFDAQFRPIACCNQQRWIRVAMAWSLDIPLPPVELIRVRQAYFVRDGHHRVSAAKRFGREFIEAEVIVWQTESTAQPIPSQSKPALRPSRSRKIGPRQSAYRQMPVPESDTNRSLATR